MTSKRVLSGIQPTGNLHLGNYLGAIKNFVTMQNDYECFYMLADLHAITVSVNPDELRENILNTAATFLACGLDEKKNIIFCQSQVQAHSELSWILNCIARVGWLNRMTQFKEKAGSNKEKASVGLYTYPILMAADILIYQATHVPVGEDQKQHLELCRDIATKFNNDYKNDFFTIPEPIIPKSVARIMSLRDGTKKMSKSEDSDLSRINLTDSKDQIMQKVKKAKTDSEPINERILVFDTKRYEAQNLIKIYASLNSESPEKIIKNFDGKSFSDFKNSLAELLVEKISPISDKIKEYKNDKEQLIKILKNGNEQASNTANKTIIEVKKIVGLI
ncbi:MAG: tryptophan--tRNA ligase [Pelagibacteraceae bacterium]|nr:tryptophan--tRNA ligase [Pelagibacteraceae bacterium]MCI5079941.1 tryptophan--tRNA ligase [Pelagibacteraceae bacterium]